MSEKNPSQAQQMNDGRKRSIDEGVARFQAGFEEMAKLEQMATEQMRVMLTDAARLQQDGLSYLGKLNAECRRLSLEAVKRGSELFTARS